jgi:hypothetical protein
METIKLHKPVRFYQPIGFQKKILVDVLKSLEVDAKIDGILLNIEGKNIPLSVMKSKVPFTDEILDSFSFGKLVSLCHHLGWDDTKKGRAQEQTEDCLHKFIYTRNINHLPTFIGMIKGHYVNITNVIRMVIMRKYMLPFEFGDMPLYDPKEELLNALNY